MTVTHHESMIYGALRADLETAIKAAEDTAYECRRLGFDEWNTKLLECSECLRELRDRLNTDEMWARYAYGMVSKDETDGDD